MMHWTEIELRDGDDFAITGDARIGKLAQYRSNGYIDGAFIVDPETGEWDWETGPAVDEIDWTDFPG